MALSDYFKNPLVESAYSFSSLRHGNKSLRFLRELDRSQYFPVDQLHQIQLTKLRKLLKIAHDSSPFWRERFKQAGLDHSDISRISSLESIPKLTKNDIIQNRDKILCGGISKAALILNKSGGTTGSPLSYYLDKHKVDVREAATLRHNLWAGYKIGDKLVTLWGAPGDLNHKKTLKSSIKDLFYGKILLLDSTSLTEESIQNFISNWDKFKPDVLLAYSGALRYIVSYLKDRNQLLSPVGSIIVSAEVLESSARAEIESYFGIKVFERYGCREVSVIASECEYHNGLHINAENLFLELETIEQIDDSKRLAKILITDLENHVFPLIRYQLGDVVVVNDKNESCACGRGLPKIDSVSGRVSEFIKLKDGKMISGTGLTVSLFSKADGIRKTQIVQKKHDEIILRIVKDDKFNDESVSILEREFKRIAGNNISLKFEFPDDIKREKSGKYRLVISELME